MTTPKIPKGHIGMWKYTAVSCEINKYSGHVMAHSMTEAIRKVKYGTFDGDRVSKVVVELVKVYEEGK